MEILKKIKNKLNYILTDFASWKHVSWPMRAKILRWLGMDIHETALIGYNCKIMDLTKFSCGENVVINNEAYIGNEGGVKIAEYARLGPQVMILTRSHPYENNVIRRLPNKDIDIECTIGKGCWLGARSIILPGVNLAEGCIIAAGSVVTKSTEPNGLYAGSPAKRIKDLPVGDED